MTQRAACGPGEPADLTDRRQEAVEGVGGANGGDDDRGVVYAFPYLRPAVVHDSDPDGRPVVGKDLRRLLSDADGAPGPLDALLEGAGDPSAAAAGKPSALEVVGDDQRVHGEGRA